ncbi:sialic acid TRAP transporter substrate-binding protein SiaP [Psychromonas hadalis]|uniref:sialic acid TRAP transporter substrate-binding protein SiaP n=1 Tax=Psychromonas hadalis TaxID=211669 RepID=UPI0003B50456|nr:sialic acid TRAP transporter substrate-binding protein SiaP [Psychromonas hadalis]
MKKLTLTLLSLSFAMVAHAETTLKMGLQANVGSAEYTSAKLLSDTIAELSDGEMKLLLYPGAQLGDDRAMLQQVTMGDLDFTFAEFGRMGLWIPRAEAVMLPYVVKDFAHSKRIFNSDFGLKIREEMLTKFNWRALDTWYNGTRQTSSNRPLKSIEDFKGLKLRVPNAKANLSFAKYSGASPTPMAFSEVYLALQTNAVDGQENPLTTFNTMKFYEVQPYLAMTNHILNDQMILVSEVRWSKLSDKQKEIINKAVKSTGEKHTSFVNNQEKELISYFQKEGVTITYPELAPFREAMKPVYKEFEKKLGQLVIKQITEI